MNPALHPVVVNILFNPFSEGTETIDTKYEDNFQLGKTSGRKLVKLSFQIISTGVNGGDQENKF